MNKAEKYAKIVECKKTSFSNWIRYFFLLMKYKGIAMLGYTGTNEDPNFANPWLLNKLKDEGFIIDENAKNSKGNQCTCVSWIIDNDDDDDNN